jgi:hypothetical protein
MAMRRKKKAAKSKARKQTARRAPAKARKAAPRKKAAAKRADPAAALGALARKIVKVTTDGGDYLSLYAPDVTSTEATGDVSHGLAGLAEKGKSWEQMQEGVTWKARSVCVDARSGTICIEWDATVKLRGGPTVPMPEVAIHETRNGKIVAERYYYNPMALMPQGGGQTPPG